jgi:hypothetical protein
MVCTQGLGHLQPALVDVGDHNLGGTHRLRRQQINQPWTLKRLSPLN